MPLSGVEGLRAYDREGASKERMERQMQIARVIFDHFSQQTNGRVLNADEWQRAVELWRREPALYPMLQTSVAAATDVIALINTGQRPDTGLQ